jgi:adenylosuccinate lyase
MHAEIYSFGLKFLYLYNDLLEERKKLSDSFDYVVSGKISGAVGTFAYFSPKTEEYICKKIGINWAKVSTQIVSRERFAYFLFLLSLLGSTLERFATEIRHLHRTEVDEAKEPFYSGQKGSSAMPHKQNPIVSERICGLARLLRSNAFAASENINLWHERDISHSSVERVIIPDSTIIIDYMLQKFKEVVSKIKVNPKSMIRNIELNRGIIYSQKVLTELMKKGLSRMDAYDLIQKISLEVINNNSNFKEEIFKNKRIRNILDEKILNKIFDPYSYLSNIDKIYKRFNLS